MSAHHQPPRPRPLLGQLTLPWAVAILAVVACVALAAWAVSLRNDRDAAEDRVASLVQERDQIRRAATATVYELAPTADAPADASGRLYLTATGSGVLDAVNLPAPGEGRVYQLWFHLGEGEPPLPGATFTVDANGIGFARIAADSGPFAGISISEEPAGGSATPTGPMLLAGDAAGARG